MRETPPCMRFTAPVTCLLVNTTATPRWGTYQQSRRHSGLSARLLQDFVRDGLVRSSLVKKPGTQRGVRLIDLRSLDEFIELGVGGKVDLAMNKKGDA